jgi:hypothetical protein
LPVETNVAVDPEDEDCALPIITTVVSFVVRVTGELETTRVVGEGSTMPWLPVEMNVAVLPETLAMAEP